MQKRKETILEIVLISLHLLLSFVLVRLIDAVVQVDEDYTTLFCLLAVFNLVLWAFLRAIIPKIRR